MDTSFLRQDSLIISNKDKNMNRLVEFIYTVKGNIAKLLSAHGPKLLPQSLIHYGQEKKKADHVYRIK